MDGLRRILLDRNPRPGDSLKGRKWLGLLLLLPPAASTSALATRSRGRARLADDEGVTGFERGVSDLDVEDGGGVACSTSGAFFHGSLRVMLQIWLLVLS